MDVAVVGGGIHGVSAARRLAEAGHRVVLFEPGEIPNPRGSSGGNPRRIVRRAYPDVYHTGLMTEAYPLWRELEAASGERLFHEVGMLAIGPLDGEYVAGLAHALGVQGVPFLRGGEYRIPGLRLGRGESAVFVPEAGWVESERAVAATYRLALAAGAEHIRERARDLDRFDRVVVCAGPWVRDFWPDAPVRVTLQATAYLRRDQPGPVWIEEGPDLLYGFPSEDGFAKVGVHRPGPEFDPNDPNRPAPESMIEAIQSYARRRFGGDEPEVVQAVGCPYTVTPDEGFRFHRPDARTLVVSACSGHGFKFGPWVGVKVAQWLGGETVSVSGLSP